MASVNSEIAICNVCLAKLGEDSIRTFDEKNKRARLSKTLYDFARDTVLGSYDWSFARRYVTLQSLDETGMFDYVYALPSDCINPIRLHPFGKYNKWEVMDNKIHTDVGNACLHYSVLETNPSKFTSSFINALTAVLTFHLAMPITGDKTLTNAAEQTAAITLMQMQENDANLGEGYRESIEEPDLDPFVTGIDTGDLSGFSQT